jgi:hypothetical protein
VIYLANPIGPAVVAHMRAGSPLGLIDTPRQRNRTDAATVQAQGGVWCADNGCYSDKWDEDTWWAFLTDPRQLDRVDTCLFAVAPDIVGDAWRSHMRSYPWLAKIRKLGYPVAYVIQNRAERHPIPWHDFDVLFVGGCVDCPEHGAQPDARRVGRGHNQRFHCLTCDAVCTEWKTGPDAQALVAEAKRRGKWVHMGRVNSQKRYEYARAIGCDSVDGTFLVADAESNLPRLLGWLNNRHQSSLFGVTP